MTTKVRTNSKQVKEAIRAHILDCVTDIDGNNFPTSGAAKDYLRNEFDRVANYPHNVRRIPSTQERFRDYLMGIPFGFEYADHAISDFLHGIGLVGDFPAEKSRNLYASLIYREIIA